MKILNSIVLLLILSISAFAAGETGLAVLKIGVGARATAMGEAFSGMSDDPSGIYWNPAGSAWAQKRQAHFSYNSWIQGMNHNVAAMTFPTKVGSFGIGLLLNNIDGFERRISASEEPLGTFSSHDFSVALNYSRRIGDNVSFGANLKYINEKIYIEDANGYMVDLGARYNAPVDGLWLAAAVQNLGFTTAMSSEEIHLPQIIRLGAAYQAPFEKMKDKVLLAVDYVQIIEESGHLNIGAEYAPVPLLALRVGYQTGFDTKDLSAGFGVTTDWLNIDYAYVPFGRDLGDSHRFSLTTSF
jgi:hypothetical protein